VGPEAPKLSSTPPGSSTVIAKGVVALTDPDIPEMVNEEVPGRALGATRSTNVPVFPPIDNASAVTPVPERPATVIITGPPKLWRVTVTKAVPVTPRLSLTVDGVTDSENPRAAIATVSERVADAERVPPVPVTVTAALSVSEAPAPADRLNTPVIPEMVKGVAATPFGKPVAATFTGSAKLAGRSSITSTGKTSPGVSETREGNNDILRWPVIGSTVELGPWE